MITRRTPARLSPRDPVRRSPRDAAWPSLRDTSRARGGGARLLLPVILAGALLSCTGSVAERTSEGAPGTADRGSAVPGMQAAEWEALLAAEDARVSNPAHRQLLLDALTSGSDDVRAMAARALGRSERSEFAAPITALLDDSSVTVRAAAAHALGDVLRRNGLVGPPPEAAVTTARARLLEALGVSGSHDAGAAAAAETLGRLPTDSTTAAMVANGLTGMLENGATRTGALRGLYFLAWQPQARPGIGVPHVQALRRVIFNDYTVEPFATDMAGAPTAAERERNRARDRALALATLALTRSTDEQLLMSLLRDTDAQVRREAVAATATLAESAAAHRITDPAARDAVPAVRYDALRYRMARSASDGACAAAASAVRDGDANVSLLALDLLGTHCADRRHIALLDSLADGSPTGAVGAPAHAAGSWHRSVHAVVALAHVAVARDSASHADDGSRASDREQTRSRVRRLAQHSSPFARAWAARAAAVLSDTTVLRSLANDVHPIVRTAAVTGLSGTAGGAADDTYLAQLTADDSELLMAAAAALEGSSAPAATTLLLDALDRITAQQRETSRDARVALLERAQELGDARSSARLTRYLNDFDAEVAGRAAGVLEAWTGTRPDVQPVTLPDLPLPSYDEATQLARSVFVLTMADGREIGIRLLPFAAPTNAARFARLARSGYFNGLTFHRVVPNFVVQGGSPGANEYSGDGPFTRDELAAPNWRATVGLSTRGRDTGDAQFYINLVDNVRLDHEYTVFGVVVSGMNVVDSLLEGAVIRVIREER